MVTPKPLEFGTAMHAAWATYYDPDLWHIPRTEIVDLMLSEFLKVVNEQKSRYLDLKQDLPYELEEEFNERVELGTEMIKHYCRWAPTVDNFTPVKVEVEFEVPIKNPGTGAELRCECHGWPVVYQGRLDGIVRDQFGYYWVLEHKTAGQLQPTTFLPLDDQVGSYAWAMRELGLQVRGIIYNEALKDWPEPPKRLKSPRLGRNYSVNKNQRTTYEIYLQTLIDAGEDISLYTEILEYLKELGNPFFRRSAVHRSDRELDDIGRRIYLETLDIIDPNLRIYPNPSRINCNGCSFREPCIMKQEGSDYDFILRELYVLREESNSEAQQDSTKPEPAGTSL